MADLPKSRFPALAILLVVSGWAGLFISSHSKLIGTAAAAVGSVAWTAVVGLTSKIWARVEKTIVDLAGDALDTYIRDFASRYRKRYFEHLQQRHRTFDVKGLSTQGIYALEIGQVYIELTVDPKQAAEVSANPIPHSLPAGRRDIWAFLGSRHMHRQDFAILGAPGSGKTTLLKHITLGLAANRGKVLGIQRTPVLLFIRDHAAAIGSQPDRKLVDLIDDSAAKMGIPAPTGWFQRELDQGHCLVMLDGLDEVADAELRRVVAAWVETQMQAFGTNRFLVTSRPFGYRSNPLGRVTVLEVRAFNSDQTERFINNWYLANEVMGAQKDDEGVRIAAREGAADLLKRIRATPALMDLAVNPLLLTMIANVHRYRSSLPGRRVELYAEICEVFLGKRQQARGIDLDLTPAQKKRVLQPLAFHAMLAQKRELLLAEAVSIVAGPLSLVSPAMKPEEFLRMIEDSSGLLLERESGVYSFAHLTFQEFLAASHILEENLEGQLVLRVGTPWWHETIHLFVALADATRIVEACIASGSSVASLALAVECLDEARAVRPDLRLTVESLIADGIDRSDRERARLAAETKLALRLRRLTRIDDHHYADSGLISCAEYQLFIDERVAAGQFHQPDHWTNTHFAVGTARQPVLGVRPSDAEAFCRWLSEREGGDWIYKIPETDMADQPCEPAAYWTRAQGVLKLCGTPMTLGRRTKETLRERLGLDTAAIDISVDVDLELTRALYYDLDVDLSRDIDLIRASARDLARALYRALNRDLDLTGALDRAFDRAVDRALDFTRALDLDLALDLDPDRGRDRDLTRDFALYRDLDLELARARARHRARDLDRALYRALDRALNRALDRDRVQERALSRVSLLFAAASAGKSHRMPRWYDFHRVLSGPQHLAEARFAPHFYLDAYVRLAVLEERIEGKLAAVEGIRIMKVRREKEAANQGETVRIRTRTV